MKYQFSAIENSLTKDFCTYIYFCSCRLEGFPSISALKFNGGLTLGVGTASGQILLYDIRSNKPFCVKDHMYGLPIKDIDFHYQNDLIYSMDASILKIWDKNNVSMKVYICVNFFTVAFILGKTAHFN